ncbi:hypothetical protein BN946_scf184969.g49 [Trametes cinnabarina]|uniref:Uncharacterized protein n=1 Tax=Pycnoporus cinnabarinus TaxID=5643 RepID=A0A060SYR8_PYCCI|nr:hypothetical protein BN946_scf184969.g49 [Trametes cinnabarina]
MSAASAEISHGAAIIIEELAPPLASLEDMGSSHHSGRRPVRANRMRLPARYQDLVPHGPSPLPPHRLPSPLPSDSANIPADGVAVDLSTQAHRLGADSPSAQPTALQTAAHAPSPPASPPLPVFRTKPNRFGLVREYIGELPTIDPDDELPIEDLVESDSSSADLTSVGSQVPPHSAAVPVSVDRSALIAPYPNMSTYLLGNWYWNDSRTKSTSDRDDLVNNVILHKDFVPEDLRNANWAKIDKELGNGSLSIFPTADGWHHADVTISVPFAKDSPPRDFTVRGLVFRPLEEVVKAVCESHLSARFHYHPFRLLWQPPAATPGPLPVEQEVYGELYASKVFRDADAELQRSPREPGCNLPRAIIALMPWSDSTHLADFGDASLWPIYAQFGNQSKYTRAQPSSNASQHVAYIPKLPAEIHDFIHQFLQKEGIDHLLTHCRRELVQAIWRLLLSDKFVEACRHGIVVKCYDGVTRRLYIRFFTYSADYPEKVLLATIRDMGNCPCPRCLVPKDHICELGTSRDQVIRDRKARVDDDVRKAIVQQARDFIMKKGLGVNSTAVEAILKPQSLVPTLNAFSERLGPHILPNFHSLFVPDFMHEWELGVWKGLMTHIVRILHAAKGGASREFNARFRKVPTFGRDAIRRFSANMSEMKQFAAHDFEDSLQCFIPPVDRLLPEPHNTIILDVVFLSAELHGLHKLQLHTEATTSISDAVLVEYGKALRLFKRVTCTAYHTVELPKETAARMRRQTRKPVGNSDSLTSTAATTSNSGTRVNQQNVGGSSAGTVTARRKEYNLNTYKHHSLGDYTPSIRTIGTQDSYTTRNGELEHRRVKRRFERTSKHSYTRELAQIERREAHLNRITHELTKMPTVSPKPRSEHPISNSDQHPRVANAPASRLQADLCSAEDLEAFPASDHHHIAKSQNNHIYLPHYVHRNQADRALKDFIPKLQNHLLGRVEHGRGSDTVFTESDRRNLLIEHDRIYSHQLLRINYTTYDVRRGQDVINPSTERCNIMLLAHEDEDGFFDPGSEGRPTERCLFWYAQVLGIYHANIINLRDGVNVLPKRMEFLFVRWFGHDPEWSAGWAHRRLEQVGFVPETDSEAFGFVNPEDVVRACHLIPAFAEGRTTRLLGWSKIARPSGESDDWERYYVNRFADRDMLMRYLGGGVGHRSMYQDGQVPPPLPVGRLSETEDEIMTSMPSISSNAWEEGDAQEPDTSGSDRDTDIDSDEPGDEPVDEML